MPARLIRVIASALVGTAAVATVQAAEEIPPVGDLKEVYHEAAVISGGVIVGVMRSGPPSDVSPFLSAKLPTDWADVEICARVVSSDGRYQAERAYLVPSGWRDNVALMPYQTRFPEKLARYDSEHIAVAVSQGNCGARPTRFVPASWNAEELSEDHGIVLLVNSIRASEVYLFAGRDLTASEVLCMPADKGSRAAFDYRCEIPVNDLSGGVVEVELNRVRDRKLDPPLYFELVLVRE